MRYSIKKKFLWYVAFSFLIGIVPAQMAYADEYDYSSDENLSVYVDMPDFRFENGLVIYYDVYKNFNLSSDIGIPSGQKIYSSEDGEDE